MLRRHVLGSLLALPAGPALAAAATNEGPNWSLVDEALKPYVDRGELAGMTLLVMRRGPCSSGRPSGKASFKMPRKLPLP